MLRRAQSAVGVARSLIAAESFRPSSAVFSTSSASQGTPPKDDGWLPPEAAFYAHQHQWHDKYCRQRNVMSVGPRYPAIAASAYIAPSAVVAGDVDIMDGVRLCCRAVSYMLLFTYVACSYVLLTHSRGSSVTPRAWACSWDPNHNLTQSNNIHCVVSMILVDACLRLVKPDGCQHLFCRLR